MSKRGLTSSIIISIFITIMFFLALFLATNSFQEAIDGYAESVSEASEENPSAAFAGIFAGVVVGLALVIAFYVPMLFILVSSSILLPISVKNRNVEAKWIRVLSYVFDGVLSAFIIFVIIKFILIQAGLG